MLIVAQVAILCCEYLNSVYPVWIGKQIELAIRPVDPRSLFRGHYARLDYDIGSIPYELFADGRSHKLRNGEVIYISLEKSGNVWVAKGAFIKKPKTGIFIRGRIQNRRFTRGSSTVKYGIEAYFAPPEKAKDIEKALRRTQQARIDGSSPETPAAIAKVMLAPNGKAALLGIKINNHS